MIRRLAPFALLLAAACGGSSGGSEEIVIWWAQWAPADGLADLGREFEKETGLKVRVHQVPWSTYQEKVFMEFGSKEPEFDIVIGDSQWLGVCATKGLYVDLTDWLKQAVDLATVHPRAGSYLCQYPTGSGRYWAAPCETDAMGLIYRKDWFEDPAEREAFKKRFGRDLAVPATWAEFRDVAEFFTRPEKKVWGCAMMTGRGYDEVTMGFQTLLWCFGGTWHDEKTFRAKGVVNGPAAVEALAFMKDLMRLAPPGATRFDHEQVIEAFTLGSVAMAVDYFAFYPRVVKEAGAKAGFAPVPAGKAGRAISLGGQGMSIPAKKSAARQERAKKFIAWFLKAEQQKKWITKDAGFTANTEILKSDEFRKATPYNAAFADSLDHLRDFTNVPVYADMLAAAQRYLGEALDGKKTPQEALDAIAEEHEKSLKSGGLLKE